MKMIVETATGRVLGAHMVGPDSPEIMQGIAVAIKAGATKSVFDSTIGIHPLLRGGVCHHEDDDQAGAVQGRGRGPVQNLGRRIGREGVGTPNPRTLRT